MRAQNKETSCELRGITDELMLKYICRIDNSLLVYLHSCSFVVSMFLMLHIRFDGNSTVGCILHNQFLSVCLSAASMFQYKFSPVSTQSAKHDMTQMA